MIRGRKGLGEDTLVIVVIVLAATLVLGAGTKAYADWMNSKDSERCRLSAVVAFTAQDKTPTVAKFFKNIVTKIDCPAAHKEIISKEKDEDKAKNEVFDAISDEMYECWYKTGNGELSLGGQFAVDATRFCMICSTFSLDRDVDVEELIRFMDDKKTPEGMYIFDYLDTGFIKKGIYSKSDMDFKKSFFWTVRSTSNGLELDSEDTLEKGTVSGDNAYSVVYFRSGKAGMGNIMKYVFATPHTMLQNTDKDKFGMTYAEDFQSFGIAKKSEIAASGLCEDFYYQKE